jgi:hypothetical protein
MIEQPLDVTDAVDEIIGAIGPLTRVVLTADASGWEVELVIGVRGVSAAGPDCREVFARACRELAAIIGAI